MKALIPISPLLTLFMYMTVHGQNLVPNPSFETLTSCPSGTSRLDRASPWIPPTTGSPDLFNSCTGTSCFGFPSVCVPTNFFGNQAPVTGNGYAGFFAYSPNANIDYREYIQVLLTSSLVAGQIYDVSFYVSLAESSEFATNNFGAYFSNIAISRADNLNFSCCAAQVVTSGIVTDKSAWTLVSGCYTAVGGEQYITIGNFNDDASTTLTNVSGGSLSRIYYYIDDVSVVADATCGVLPIELLSFEAMAINNQKSLLTWQTASEINNDYFTIEKSTDALNWIELITVDGAGNSSAILNYQTIDQTPFIPVSYYRLKQTDFDGKYVYSNIETVVFNEINLVKVYPNPTEGILTLNISSGSDILVNLSVINSLGQKILQQQFDVKEGNTLKTIDTSNLSSGVYQVKITTPSGEYSFKQFNKR